MSAVFVKDKVEIRPENLAGADDRFQKMQSTNNSNDILIEVGIWLSGLDSFLASGHQSFAAGRETKRSPDAIKEFRLVHLTLQRCAMLIARLLSEHTGHAVPATNSFEIDDLCNLSEAFRELIILSEALINSTALGTGELKSWCNLLVHRLDTLPVVHDLIGFAEESGKKNLPQPLIELVESGEALTPEHSELALIMPRFGIVLKWLSVVGKMLDADEPLKPALLIFSKVNEQIFELTAYINNRLERFPNEEAELFSALDAASYTASIELKKVYSQELSGVSGMRPTPSIYARMETAHSLLNEGFQQILAGFARLLDPDADIFRLFPNFQTKLEQSIALRDELTSVIKVVQAAETKPEKREIERMQAELRGFQKATAKFLFYKDTETVERFIEEILITQQNKDLVPILHRFGAYLETLTGQVMLRAVLVGHPPATGQ